MNDSIFEQCNISYDTVLRIIRSVTAQIMGPYFYDERMEELIAEGWVIALEALRHFDPNRGAQPSTYLWYQLNSRLRRYDATTRERKVQCVIDNGICDQISTDGQPQSGIFDGNPWAMTPDVLYEKQERLAFWENLKSKNASGIEYCLKCMPGTPAERALVYRRRKRYMDKIQANYEMMLNKPR